MPANRISMHKLRNFLRNSVKVKPSNREICRCLLLSHTTIRNFLLRAKQAGLTWLLAEDITRAVLKKRLFAKVVVPSDQRPWPDWDKVHEELKGKGVTLHGLWTEYKDDHLRGMHTAGFATTIGIGRRGWTGSCAKRTLLGKSSSWIMLA